MGHCCAVACSGWFEGQHCAMPWSEAEMEIIKSKDIAQGRCAIACNQDCLWYDKNNLPLEWQSNGIKKTHLVCFLYVCLCICTSLNNCTHGSDLAGAGLNVQLQVQCKSSGCVASIVPASTAQGSSQLFPTGTMNTLPLVIFLCTT